MITAAWLVAAVADAERDVRRDGEHVRLLKDMITGWAQGLAAVRPGVVSASVQWSLRGLYEDEAASFLRAIDLGQASVNAAGYVTMHCVRPKRPPGRYSLFTKGTDGVSVNLEYLIQIGATAELILDFGWLPDAIDFERGQFDALGHSPAGRVVLAVEAKARAKGRDSLQSMMTSWIKVAASNAGPPDTNSGRKYEELRRLCADGPVTLWLVASGVRWTFVATVADGRITLVPTSPPRYERAADAATEGRKLLWVREFDASLHRSGTLASRGLCSWLCTNAAEYSVRVRELAGSESAFALCATHLAQVERVYDS